MMATQKHLWDISKNKLELGQYMEDRHGKKQHNCCFFLSLRAALLAAGGEVYRRWTLTDFLESGGFDPSFPGNMVDTFTHSRELHQLARNMGRRILVFREAAAGKIEHGQDFQVFGISGSTVSVVILFGQLHYNALILSVARINILDPCINEYIRRARSLARECGETDPFSDLCPPPASATTSASVAGGGSSPAGTSSEASSRKREVLRREVPKSASRADDLRRVQADGLQLQYIGDQTPEIIFAAVRKNGLALKYATYQTLEMIRVAVLQNPIAVLEVRNLTINVLWELVQICPSVLEYIDSDFHLKLVIMYPAALQYMEQTSEIVTEAILFNKKAIQYVQNPSDYKQIYKEFGGIKSHLRS